MPPTSYIFGADNTFDPFGNVSAMDTFVVSNNEDVKTRICVKRSIDILVLYNIKCTHDQSSMCVFAMKLCYTLYLGIHISSRMLLPVRRSNNSLSFH
mmetsp:Transcript_9878/g.14862  ORF Transcript_9878/g.14862 Transcript_9878/m.14862 type:complete len:97 (+) Transcript_9878:2119-2409(+)